VNLKSWAANNPDLNPANYCIWGMMLPIQDVADLRQRLIDTCGVASCKALWTMPLMNAISRLVGI